MWASESIWSGGPLWVGPYCEHLSLAHFVAQHGGAHCARIVAVRLFHTRMRVRTLRPEVRVLCGQIGMSCLASFVGLPSDLTPYSGCAELPIGDVLMI